jgi:hypothetical protein
METACLGVIGQSKSSLNVKMSPNLVTLAKQFLISQQVKGEVFPNLVSFGSSH